MAEIMNQKQTTHGALVSVEQQRAIAQVQAALMVARSMPRDRKSVVDLIINDCGDPDLAADATYEYSRGGTSITGPSIRLLEAVARRWGNMESGIRELHRGDGYSECEAYAWDMETNMRDSKTFQVKHWRDTKKGGYKVTDERDIYEIVANTGARRKRACMEAVIDRSVINEALRTCELTLKSKISIDADYISKLLEGFKPFGVTKAMIEARIQRKIDALTPGLAVQLRRVYTSLRDGMSVAADHFDTSVESAPGQEKQSETPTGKAAAQVMDDAKFAKELMGWTKLILAGKKTPDEIIAIASSKVTLSADQIAAIRSANPGAKVGEVAEDSNTSILSDVKRICAQAIEMRDTDTAYARLDDAKFAMQEINPADKAAGEAEIAAATEAIKAREQK